MSRPIVLPRRYGLQPACRLLRWLRAMPDVSAAGMLPVIRLLHALDPMVDDIWAAQLVSAFTIDGLGPAAKAVEGITTAITPTIWSLWSNTGAAMLPIPEPR